MTRAFLIMISVFIGSWLSAQACEIVCPGAQYIECNISEVPIYDSLQELLDDGGSIDGDCELNSFTIISAYSDGSSCPETVTRVYQISDLEDNLAHCEMIIFISDDIDPNLSCPSNITDTAPISAYPPYMDYTAFIENGGIGDDNCGLSTNTFTLVSELDDGDACFPTYTRVYQIEDDCGNLATCEQVLVLAQDTESEIAVSACVSYTSPSGNFTWTETATYEDIIPNFAGCDSVITINLTIEDNMVEEASSGMPNSLDATIMCAVSMNEIIISDMLDTLRMECPLIFQNDMTITGENGHVPVIEFDFGATDLANAAQGILVMNGNSVTFQNVILKEKSNLAEKSLLRVDGTLQSKNLSINPE